MTQLNPIINAIENFGGSASIPQVSSATSLKRDFVQQELQKFVSSGVVDHVGGQVYRISPDRLTPQVEAPAVAPPAVEKPKASAPAPAPVRRQRGKDRQRRKSPISEKVIDALVSLGGVARLHEIAAAAGLSDKQTGDSLYRLRQDGLVVANVLGQQVLVGHVAPAPVVEPVVEPETAPEPEAVETPEPEAGEPEVIATEDQVISFLVGRALDVIAPDGVPLTKKATRLTADFTAAAEGLIRLLG